MQEAQVRSQVYAGAQIYSLVRCRDCTVDANGKLQPQQLTNQICDTSLHEQAYQTQLSKFAKHAQARPYHGYDHGKSYDTGRLAGVSSMYGWYPSLSFSLPI